MSANHYVYYAKIPTVRESEMTTTITTYLADSVVRVGEEDSVEVWRVGGHQQQDALLQHQHVPAAALVVALAPHEHRADHLLWVGISRRYTSEDIA
jgi:hypothetical protein